MQRRRLFFESIRCFAGIAVAVLAGTVFPGEVTGAESDSGRIVLVEKGVAKCVIVAADGLSPSEKTAISELQKYIQAMSGAAKIEVVTPEQAAAGTGRQRLVVGNKTVRKLYPDEQLDDLGTDGFILKTAGNSLLVAGGEKRGTLYAAFELLEKLGCRWWAVGATHIPKKDTLTVAPLNERQIPKLEYRDMLYGDRGWISNEENGNMLYIHNKINGFNYTKNPEELGGRINFESNLVHTHARLMKQAGDLDGSFKKHPEYWALVNGKNVPDQVCPTNPMVFEIMKANVIKQLKEHPEYEFVVVGQEDNRNYCRCENCSRIAQQEESQAGPGLVLANKISEVVEKEFPGKWVMTPAYEWSRKPPKNIRPRGNVGVTLCSIECDFNRPLAEGGTPANKAFADDLVQWGKIAPKLYIWDYTTNFYHYLMPFPDLDAIVPNIKFMAAHGVKGILEQGSHTTKGAEFAQLRMWVLARALWNPEHADGKALIKEFLEGYYGPAAGSIQKYIDAVHAPGRSDPAMSAGCYARLDAAWLTPAAIAEAEAFLQEAERVVEKDPVLLTRVRHAHLPVWYVLLKRGPQSHTWAAAAARAGKLDIVDIAEKFSQAVTDNKITQIAEGETIASFVEWAKDYASKSAKSSTVPPELKDIDPKSYRLIQACQMDERGRWWMRDAEASDSWVSEVPITGWRVNVRLSPFEDVVPGKEYRLFTRVKSSAKTRDGMAFSCGLYDKSRKVNLSKKVPAAELADGQFHTVEVGKFTAAETPGSFWIALSSATAPKVFLDCLWLQEVTK